MHSLTAVPRPSIPSVPRASAPTDPAPLFEALVAEYVAAGKSDPRSLFGSPPGSGNCFCEWNGHGIYTIPGGEGGRIGRTHHP